MLSYSTTLKKEVDYYPLPNGTVDVFLRKRLPEEVDSEGNETFVYDEVSINTTLPREIIEEYFDMLFEDPAALDEKPEKEFTTEQMAITLMQTQIELEDAQTALDFLLMGVI